ncbi:hypothetical protein MVEN_00500700 [Mycena venus]|uniref:Integrase core domain-containing protein n=1 Tax=Mycena venus TaxID=2733690 RepID=A0A8H7D8J5_9AGAR|nr:hypothetical protein MVEN_00500700 [Mycena venus]
MSDQVSEALENLQIAYQILKRNTNEVLQFSNAVQLHRAIIPPLELATVEQSITDIVEALNAARHESSDAPTGANLVVTWRTSTSVRPRVDIDRNILAQALDYGLVQPGQSVYTDTPQPDGTVSCTSSGSFGAHFIHYTPYNVARANSLWHHDGQHGLIRFKIVIHCFIDGKSRLVTGIRISTNNCAETVLRLFRDAVTCYGLPSELRGSYIWGRSVNNTCIERLWYDVTHAFGYKWKKFFIDLEVNHGLNPTMAEHIWLLHHLFLHSIDKDAQEWAEAWNQHDIQIRGERTRSPHDIFFFSQLQDGPRGLERMVAPPDNDVSDPSTYGIDWDVIDDPALMQHHLLQNPEEWADSNPLSPNVRDLSEVSCEAPNSPFSPQQIAYLDCELAAAVDLTSHSMNMCKMVWKEAFRICNEFYV